MAEVAGVTAGAKDFSSLPHDRNPKNSSATASAVDKLFICLITNYDGVVVVGAHLCVRPLMFVGRAHWGEHRIGANTQVRPYTPRLPIVFHCFIV
jgi:hypothetical protein